MPYTLRQVRPLLTKPELELFEASRAAALKELTPRQLAGKVTRSRNLRDKYRDLHRRQTAAAQRRSAKERNPTGGENERTQQKADILAEVLTRFEQYQSKLLAQAEAAKTKASKAGKDKTGTAKLPTAQALVQDVKKAVKNKAAKPAEPGQPSDAAAQNSPVATTVSALAQGGVPAAIEARAQRVNTLKEKPVNQKIHASQRGRNKAHQAKRDH